MADVTVEQSKSGEWWRLTYRGQVDLCESEPTEAYIALFRQGVDARAKEIRRAPSGRQVEVKEYQQHGQASTRGPL